MALGLSQGHRHSRRPPWEGPAGLGRLGGEGGRPVDPQKVADRRACVQGSVATSLAAAVPTGSWTPARPPGRLAAPHSGVGALAPESADQCWTELGGPRSRLEGPCPWHRDSASWTCSVRASQGGWVAAGGRPAARPRQLASVLSPRWFSGMTWSLHCGLGRGTRAKHGVLSGCTPERGLLLSCEVGGGRWGSDWPPFPGALGVLPADPRPGRGLPGILHGDPKCWHPGWTRVKLSLCGRDLCGCPVGPLVGVGGGGGRREGAPLKGHSGQSGLRSRHPGLSFAHHEGRTETRGCRVLSDLRGSAGPRRWAQ